MAPRSEASELCMWSLSPQFPPQPAGPAVMRTNLSQDTEEPRSASKSGQAGVRDQIKTFPACFPPTPSPPPRHPRASTLCSSQLEGFALLHSGCFVLLSNTHVRLVPFACKVLSLPSHLTNSYSFFKKKDHKLKTPWPHEGSRCVFSDQCGLIKIKTFDIKIF